MIKFDNVSKSFPGGFSVGPITAEVAPKQIIALVGPSGGGKSTLLRMVNFLEQPSKGAITVNDRLLTQANATVARQKIGMVFQHFHLFPHLTVEQNITLAPQQLLGLSTLAATKLAAELLEKVGLSDKARVMPKQLSGGQKQRVAIARALAMKPEVMLFDEPTSALDPENANEVAAVIQHIVKEEGMTTLLASHQMPLVKAVANRVWFMESGVIIEDSEASKFFSAPSSLRAQQFLEHPND